MNSTEILKRSKYFKDLEDFDFFALQRCLKSRVINILAGNAIINEGDKVNSCYIIITGKARSYHYDSDGKENFILEYNKDTIFGLDYALGKELFYNEALIAYTDCMILVIDSFKALNLCENRCKRHTDFIRHILDEYTRQVQTLKGRNYQLSQSKTREKVSAYLLERSRQLKKNNFTIPFNREELAIYLGVERSALSDTLSKMKKDGLIDFNKSQFKILNKKDMQK